MFDPFGIELRGIHFNGPESPPKVEKLGFLIVGLIHWGQVGIYCPWCLAGTRLGGRLGQMGLKEGQKVGFLSNTFSNVPRHNSEGF